MTTTRDAFEAWIIKEKRWAEFMLVKDNGHYFEVETDMCWEFWQAATSAERERCAKVSEKLTAHRRMVLGAINGTKVTQCEIAAAIRQGGDA